jgi:hypothetical protein
MPVLTVPENFRSPGKDFSGESSAVSPTMPILAPPKDWKLRLTHARHEDIGPKVEFMIAGREDVRRRGVDQVDNMGALVEARHQRGRNRVAGMDVKDIAALGALGLDDRGKAGETTAGLARHLVDVVDEKERHIDRFGQGHSGRKPGGQSRRDKAANKSCHGTCLPLMRRYDAVEPALNAV